MRFPLFLCLAGLLAGCATIKKPILYSAEKEGRQITLLGTIHRGVLANDLPGAVTDALAKSKAAFFETNFRRFQAILDARGDPAKEKRFNRQFYFRKHGDALHPAEPTLEQRLPAPVWALLQKRFPQYKPGFLTELNPEGALALLQQGHEETVEGFEAYRLSPANSMDLNLFRWARDEGVRTMRLDRSDEVCADELTAETVKQIQKILEGNPGAPGLDSFRDMVEAYRAGDEERLRNDASALEEGPEGQCLLERRNREWAGILANYLQPGERAFVAVGAMHLLTTRFPSLLSLLREQGYSIRRISP